MIGSLASLATSVGKAIAAWIEAAYVLDCTIEEEEAGRASLHDLAWLPALSGVTVAGAQAVQSHALKGRAVP
ncbi:hypothetical protein [Paenarthrobacter nitroguajacolicus]|uniref:hypothetical protein n=1 Tax=Paenarthrobacter nitroguajacolicus TaxID=211146 RepID=UPI004054011C